MKRKPRIDGDSDVVAGFPVKRFVLILLYANLMFLGGGFVWVQIFDVTGYLERSGMYIGFVEFGFNAAQEAEGILADLEDAADWGWWAVAGYLIPGTTGGMTWYLILRWRESVILKKRRDALLANTVQIAAADTT